jgi:P pilus assembly chaperone PapD
MVDMATTDKTPSSDTRSGWGLLWILIFFIVLSTNVIAGVLVAPTVVFLSDKNRTARLDVNNPGSTPQEVSVYLAFGLPVSDSNGNVAVVLQDSNITDPRSAVEWVKAFPRQVIIPPNGTQVVRFVVNPPKDLPAGEYWARVVVRSEDGETSIPTPTEEGAITTKLNMVMQTAIMLKYRTGDLTSEVALTKAEAQQTDTSIFVLVDLQNKGNASYVGIFTARLLDANKKVLAQQNTDVAVYRDLKRRIEFPTTGAGPYKIEVAISTEGRTDIAPEDMIPGNKIFSTVDVQ